MISISNLHKTFRGQSILRDVTLTIGPGERIALVGQNGSGKTTLIRCLLGLYNFEGSIQFYGKSPRTDRIAVLHNVGFVPQHPPGLRLTVSEYIATVTHLTGCAAKDINELADRLDLRVSDHINKPFAMLSGGMKQKLMIAAALARKPSLLIMDEPAANLDPRARAKFFESLQSLPSDTTMLLSSHRIDEITGLVTRLIEMDHGDITIDKPNTAHPFHGERSL
jgi:ABC-2 type transport system ATP-binding protein